jgi:hypothetical protein
VRVRRKIERERRGGEQDMEGMEGTKGRGEK